MPEKKRMGNLDTKYFGTIFRVRTWDHNPDSTMRLNYSIGKQPKGEKTVAMMCCLGEAPIDAPEPPDFEAIMQRLGWQRIPDTEVK